MRNFRELEIWKEGMGVTTDIYKITNLMPTEEEYGLKRQLRRAAVSIPSNIAEGCSRSSQRDYIRFLEISLGSAFESETQLMIAVNIGLLTTSIIARVLDKLGILQRKINTLITILKSDLQ